MRSILGEQRQLGGLEGVRLGHGLLGAMEAVQDEFPEEAETYLAGHIEQMLSLVIDEKDMIADLVAGDVDVFAHLNKTLGAEDERAAIAPRAEPVRRVPVHSDIV